MKHILVLVDMDDTVIFISWPVKIKDPASHNWRLSFYFSKRPGLSIKGTPEPDTDYYSRWSNRTWKDKAFEPLIIINLFSSNIWLSRKSHTNGLLCSWRRSENSVTDAINRQSVFFTIIKPVSFFVSFSDKGDSVG